MLKAFVAGASALTFATLLAVAPVRATTITLTNLGQVTPSAGGVLFGPGVIETSSSNAPQSVGANPSDPSGWDPWGSTDVNSRWLSVGGCCGGTGSFAALEFAVPTTTFKLLWGSPNSDNTITLYGAGNVVLGTVSFVDGSGYAVDGVHYNVGYGPNTTDPGDIIAISSSTPFVSAVLTNDQGGFEVAAISATPLPSTWSMMLIALAGLGLVAFRRGGGRVAGFFSAAKACSA